MSSPGWNWLIPAKPQMSTQVIGRLIPLEIIRLRATCLQVEQFEPALALIELLDNN
jgi:hypothetical protein